MNYRLEGTVLGGEDVELGQEVVMAIRFIVTETGMDPIDVTRLGDDTHTYAFGPKYARLRTLGRVPMRVP